MPGIELNKFFNLSQSEKDELICGVCLCIFVDPMVTPCCRQTYCRDCITQWLNISNYCPNDRQLLDIANLNEAPRLILNLLNKLQIKCDYSDNGCQFVATMETLEQHRLYCLYDPDSICKECGFVYGISSEHNCVLNLLKYINTIENVKERALEKNSFLEKENEELKIHELDNSLKGVNSSYEILVESNEYLFCEKVRITKKAQLLELKFKEYNQIIKNMFSKNFDQKFTNFNNKITQFGEKLEKLKNKNIQLTKMISESSSLSIKQDDQIKDLITLNNKLESESIEYKSEIEFIKTQYKEKCEELKKLIVHNNKLESESIESKLNYDILQKEKEKISNDFLSLKRDFEVIYDTNHKIQENVNQLMAFKLRAKLFVRVKEEEIQKYRNAFNL